MGAADSGRGERPPGAAEVWTMGELLAEVMRPRPGTSLKETGPFVGPFPSGAPGIFIDTVARLGHSAAIASGVGDDDFGACILERLRRDGVNTDCVEVFPGRSTGVAFVTYSRDGSRRFLFHWDGTPAVMGRVPEPFRVEGARLLHVMGCSLMANDVFRDRLFQAVELFSSRGSLISFDPNIRFELLQGRSPAELVAPILRHCSLLMPGETELSLLGGRDDPRESARVVLDATPVQVIVIKRGRRGCTVMTRDEEVDVPAFRVREKDPTGAGDCFDAGFVCGWLEGLGPHGSAVLAAAAGALNAMAFGPMEGRINPSAVAALMRRTRARAGKGAKGARRRA
jgi:sugar/nucleoside kinase (ribokinase family)